MIGEFYGGTSGLQIPMPKRDFPQEYQHLSRLGFYAMQENSLEVNSSFYKLPQSKTICRWASEVPEFFHFTFKLWKEVSHQKNLFFKSNDVRLFMEAIVLPKSQRGCLLVQFPPSLQVNSKPQLTELLKILIDYEWPLAVEFRHNSWYKDDVFELLNRLGIAMVIQDMPKSASPLKLTSDELVYLRFHGPSGNYKGNYSEDFLYDYAMYIREWLQDGRTVYCYFNNTAGSALENLNFLRHCLD